jgi:hypothetical protein
MIDALERALEHGRVHVRAHRAGRERAREREQIHRRRARAEHEQPTGLRRATAELGELRVHDERLLASAARGREPRRIDDCQVEARVRFLHRAPRVAALEVGAVTLVRRLHPRLARWLRAIAVRWLPAPLATVRIPLTLLRDVGVDVDVDVDAHADRRMLRVEKWLIRHVIRRIPGSGA